MKLTRNDLPVVLVILVVVTSLVAMVTMSLTGNFDLGSLQVAS